MEESSKQELFRQMDEHLVKDEIPSQFYNQLLKKKEFQEYPFNLLYALSKTEQSPVYHPEGNAWIHTMMVIDEAAKVKKMSSNERKFMWGALLHDIGKPETTRLRKGRITSYGHDEHGKKLAKEFLNEFQCDREFMIDVATFVEYHMHILYVLKNMEFARAKNLLEDAEVKDVALLGWCDRMGRLGADPEKEKKQIEEFYKKMVFIDSDKS